MRRFVHQHAGIHPAVGGIEGVPGTAGKQGEGIVEAKWQHRGGDGIVVGIRKEGGGAGFPTAVGEDARHLATDRRRLGILRFQGGDAFKRIESFELAPGLAEQQEGDQLVDGLGGIEVCLHDRSSCAGASESAARRRVES